MNVAMRMREGHAKNDDGGQADDKQTEAAHGTDLAVWIRGWRHNCSLEFAIRGARSAREGARKMPSLKDQMDWGISDLQKIEAGCGVHGEEKCSRVDRESRAQGHGVDCDQRLRSQNSSWRSSRKRIPLTRPSGSRSKVRRRVPPVG
jgi:hypothetical protein